MDTDLDRRTYDLLRLVDRHGPIGSIQLVELMQLRGYDIKDRTIRLTLSELDSIGFTEKVPGKGRRLTDSGRTELEQGNVSGRLEQIRARIATLTSRVSYDPIENTGTLVASCAFLDADDADAARSLVDRLESLPLGPLPVSLEEASETEPGGYRLLAPSSITLDGVLLARGVNADLTTAGVLEYEPTLEDDGGTVDPAAPTESENFREPGVYSTGEDEYAVYVIARRFAFQPGTGDAIRVPAGSRVTFHVTSSDVVHGFNLAGTNVNSMAIPGQVAQMTVEFDETGEYDIVCHEYCGAAHHTMVGKVVVVPQSEYQGDSQ